jgi:putative transposase
VHGRYAQYFNVRRRRCGHLWQNRFNSCPLGPAHLWTALRYVELNPQRAGLVRWAEEYEWSSAKAHLSEGRDRFKILDLEFWRNEGGTENWRRLIGDPVDEVEISALRRATYAGRPFGDRDFIAALDADRAAKRALSVGV